MFVSRRAMLQHGASLAAALALAEPVWAAANALRPDESMQRLAQDLAGLTFPDDDTPGAGTPQIARFIIVGLDHGMFDGAPDALQHVSQLLDKRSGRGFLDQDVKRRAEILGEVDRVALSAAAVAGDERHWVPIKRLIILGYYTSEVGATRELSYSPVPGRLDADLLVGNGDRAPSNNWIGNGAL